MEDTTGSHGIPMEDALDPDAEGWFEVVGVVDQAQAAIDRWRDQAGSKAEPGVRLRVIDTRP